MTQVRLADQSDLPTFCRLWNELWPSEATSVAEQERDDQTLPEPMRAIRWVAEANSFPAGLATAYRPPGQFHLGKWMIYVGVVAPARNQGVGSALFNAANNFVVRAGQIHRTTRVREDDPVSLAFAQRRGFSEIHRDFESSLDLRTVQLKDLPQEGGGIKLVSLAELDSPTFRRQFHELFEVVRVDIPRPEPPVRLTFEFFEDQVITDPNFLLEGSFVAFDDREPIGFTGIYRGHSPGCVDQWLTAVRREYRGRRIAYALKAKAILWAKDAGFDKIQTDNNSLNSAMLAINEKLGFERSAAVLTMRTEETSPAQSAT